MLHRHTCNVNLALAREATTPVKKKKKQQLKKKNKNTDINTCFKLENNSAKNQIISKMKSHGNSKLSYFSQILQFS